MTPLLDTLESWLSACRWYHVGGAALALLPFALKGWKVARWAWRVASWPVRATLSFHREADAVEGGEKRYSFEPIARRRGKVRVRLNRVPPRPGAVVNEYIDTGPPKVPAPKPPPGLPPVTFIRLKNELDSEEMQRIADELQDLPGTYQVCGPDVEIIPGEGVEVRDVERPAWMDASAPEEGTSQQAPCKRDLFRISDRHIFQHFPCPGSVSGWHDLEEAGEDYESLCICKGCNTSFVRERVERLGETCDHTFADCRRLGNEARFGGTREERHPDGIHPATPCRFGFGSPECGWKPGQ